MNSREFLEKLTGMLDEVHPHIAEYIGDYLEYGVASDTEFTRFTTGITKEGIKVIYDSCTTEIEVATVKDHYVKCLTHEYQKNSGKKTESHVSKRWYLSDVLERNKEQGVAVTDEQALRVLKRLINNHDGEIGINWETIDTETQAILEEG